MIEQPAYTGFGFSDEEWGLLAGLPQAVLAAASVAEHDSARRTMAENAAGLETIATGRESASPWSPPWPARSCPGWATRRPARSCR